MGGVRFVLPPRELGQARHVGWLMLGGSLFALAFLAVWMGLPMTFGIGLVLEGNVFGLLLIGFGLLGLLGVRYALRGLQLGLVILMQRSRAVIEIRNGRLWSNEQLLVGTWKRHCPLGQIQSLRVDAALSRAGKSSGSDPLDQLGEHRLAIIASGSMDRPLTVAPGYPADVLEPLADRLAEHMQATREPIDPRVFAPLVGERPGEPADAAGVSVVRSGDEDPADAVVHQPAVSTARVDRRGDDLTITFPPAGLRKGSKGLFVFAVIWLGFIGLFTALVLPQVIGGEDFGSDLPSPWDVLAVIGFLLVFWAVGIGMLIGAISMARRRTIIDVVGRTLLISRRTLWKTEQREFAAADLRTVELGPSGVEVNDRPIMQLSIVPRSAKAYGLLSERDDAELRWAAHELRQALGLGATSAADQAAADLAGADLDSQPAGSTIGVERTPGGFTAAIPRRGFGGAGAVVGILVVGLIFAGVGITVAVFAISGALADGVGWGDVFSIGFMLLWGTLFAGAGLGVVIGAIVMARRRYLLEVEADRLRVHRYGPFGQKTWDWPAEQVRKADVGDSGTKVNNRTLHELHLTNRSGERIKLGAGRPTEELHWLAAMIARHLDLG